MRKRRDACKCMYMCGDVLIMSPHVMLALPPNISKPYLRPPTAAYGRLRPDVTPL